MIQVITEELTPKILPEDMALIKFNEEFIERNKNSIEHLLVGAESLYLIDSSKKQDAGNLLLKVYEEYKETRTLQVSIPSLIYLFIYLCNPYILLQLIYVFIYL